MKINSELLNESYYFYQLENGLEVILWPKKGFKKNYGIFATRFGSMITEGKRANENFKLPQGIAHFLEHKLFQDEDGDVTNKFSELGAMINAFTSYNTTAYMFSTTNNLEKCVTLLLDFVQSLYLTKEAVENEKDIIIQEILMYQDDPDSVLYHMALDSLYHDYPIKYDIAGSVESVRNTTVEDLSFCHECFYHPSNMTYILVGDFDKDQIMDLIKDNQSKKQFLEVNDIKLKKYHENNEIVTSYSEKKMDVSIDKVVVSIKINKNFDSSKKKVKYNYCLNMILDCLYAKSGLYYQDLVDENLINNNFDFYYFEEEDASCIQIFADSNYVDELVCKIKDHLRIDNLKLIKEEDFIRQKKKILGSYIQVFNSTSEIANVFLKLHFKNINIFELIEIINEINFADIKDCFNDIDLNNLSVSVIKK